MAGTLAALQRGREMTTAAAPLDGRTVLVVGGAGRLGSAICRDLRARGGRVIVGYRTSREAADRLASEIDGTAVRIDTADDASIEEAFATIETAHGTVGVLVDTAHIASEPRRVADQGRAFLEVHLAAVQGYAAIVQRALPGMQAAGWGRIVYVSGALMSRPHPGFGAYGAAKSAATTLTRYVALEEGRAGITANIVAPGRVLDPADHLDPVEEELSELLLSRTALGAFPTAPDVAAVVGMLTVSPQLTGQTVWVTGGEPITA